MTTFLHKVMRRAALFRPSVRKLESDSLAATEMQVRLALEASGAAMWIIDYTRGARERFDARSCELAGLDPNVESWAPGTFCNLLHPDDRALMQAASAATHAAVGPGPIVEYRIVGDDGAMRWLQGAGIVRRDTQGRVRQFIGVSVDVTERKRLESELRATIDKLGEADRRKDEFLATLAHELRNPLAPIRNGVQILKLSMGTDETLVRTVAMMERQTSHLVRLVDDLLDVSRITRGTVQLRTSRLALSEVLSGALESVWGPSSAKQIELTVRMADEPIPIEGDRDRLTQVFSNLLLNAVKYTESGGRIEVVSHREGSDAVVSVKDTGIGIPEQALEHIFEMFSRVRPADAAAGGRGEPGLGIGLALVRQLVEMHGGAVTARSDGPGRGAELIVRLPVAEKASVARSESSMPEGSSAIPVSAGRRILVVDDHADSAASLEAILRMLGHEVRQARDGIEAIEVTQVFEPDVIFMDIGMPRLNGLDAARRIRELTLATRPSIVALTGWGQEADRKRSEQAGIDEHLVKPVELAALHRVLERDLPRVEP
ncbi:MAG TPA: ATP-binding protein [Steroidobacteraceae bacterium]|nr:ATP-binding protein [Steroidobacteraceae bacterium]